MDAQTLLSKAPSGTVSVPPEWSAASRDTDAPFHCAIGLTPDETLRRLIRSVADLVAKQSAYVGSARVICPDRLLRAHRAIFKPLFSVEAGAGRFRRWEEAHFGIPLESNDGEVEWRGLRGAPPEEIRERLNIACRPFATTNPQPTDRRAAHAAAAELLVEIVRIHPFVDGNLRVGMVAMQAALCFYGLPVARTAFNPEFMRALYHALGDDTLQDLDWLTSVLVGDAGESLGRAA